MGTPLQKLEGICAEIYSRWDADQRSGKLLGALAGGIPGYRQDVMDVRAALELAGRLFEMATDRRYSSELIGITVRNHLSAHEQSGRELTPREEELVQKALLASSEKVEK